MALGTVNVPGSSVRDLDSIKRTANAANETANAAKTALAVVNTEVNNASAVAEEAKRIAEEALAAAGTANSRLALLELRYNTDVRGNPFTATFEDLSKLRIEGVWNAAQNRIEF